MSEKMLKFIKIGQQNPPKRKLKLEKMTLMKFIKILSTKKPRNNQADVLNVEYLSAKFTVL